MQSIGYILRSFPRLSQTFILNEILELERNGVPLRIFAATNPHEPVVQPQVAEVRAPLCYLDAVSEEEMSAARIALARQNPRRYADVMAYVQSRDDLDHGYTAATRFACLNYAIYLAHTLRASQPEIGHLHAHFAHDPTLIALLVHKLIGISFSFTAHGRDLYQIPQPLLVERAAAATAVVTCCSANLAYLEETLPAELREKVQLIYHGVNLDGFQPAPRPPAAAESEPPLILSVGRLVEKKGFPDLIDACALLKRSGCRFRCAIYGDGPLRDALEAQIDRLELRGDVTLPGERPQHELIPLYQQADVFALAPFVTDDGDRDGVPNVLVEAMACGLPVVSTAVSGIPELIRHGENSMLVPPHDVEALAGALTELLSDAGQRARMATAARETAVERFNLRVAARRIAALFEGVAAPHGGLM